MKGSTISLAVGALLVASTSFGAPLEAWQTSIGNLNGPSKSDGFISIFNSNAGYVNSQVYVFDAIDEQLVACCYCQLSPNQAATMSAVKMLTSNTLTPAKPTSVTVALVTTTTNYGPTTPAPTFTTGIRGTRTSTHLAANYPGVAGNFATEAPLSAVSITAAQYAGWANTCGFINADGSGFGICGGCSTGASNAVTTHVR